MVLKRSLRNELSLSLLVSDRHREGREKSEIHVHRLKMPRICARDVGHETAVSGRWRRGNQRQTSKPADSVDAGKTANRRGIRIAFHTDQLAGEEQRAAVFELQGVPQEVV